MPEQTAALQKAAKPGGVKLVPFDALFEDVKRITDAITRRAYELFESRGRIFGREWDDWFTAESELLHPIYPELTESADSFILTAEVPGFRASDLEVSVEPQRLTIAGHRESGKEKKTGKTVISERTSDEVLRVVDLPAGVDPEKVEASLKDGILEVRLAKAAAPRKIRVEQKVA